jgi:hypothetical protein
MHNLSIYTSLYNAIRMGFNWKGALKNWMRFQNGSGEIVVAVNTSEDDTYDQVKKYASELATEYGTGTGIQVIKTEIPYTDPEFDGKIKTAALRKCTKDFCMLLDIDEVVPLTTRLSWEKSLEVFKHFPIDALLIPSIDLFNSSKEFKSIGQKWYLHRNDLRIERGTVNFAKREDGTIDITKSDTTELRYVGTHELVRTSPLLDPRWTDDVRMFYIKTGQVPYIFHLGWIDKEQRIKQSEFWAPVWNLRNGSEVEKPKTMEDLSLIQYREHGLPHWNTE